LTSDGLYSNLPFIDALKACAMSFVLVAKPTDHKVLFQWVEELNPSVVLNICGLSTQRAVTTTTDGSIKCL
jgi:hypothetical protein